MQTPESNPPPLPERSFRLESWVVLTSFWLIFGLSTIFNDIVLRWLNRDLPVINLPESTRGMIWLVVGIWVAGYMAGTLVGYLHQDFNTRRRLIGSVIVGYLLAMAIHLIYLGIFPNTPQNGYGIFLDLVHLRPLPTYYAFLLLVLVVGTGVAAVAAYTGLLFAQEMPLQLPRLALDARAVMFAALVPLAAMLLLLGLLNWNNLKVADTIRLEASLNREAVPSLVILHLDLLVHWLLNGLVVIAGAGLIGLSAVGRNLINSTLSAGLGYWLYSMLLMIVYRLLSPYGYSNAFRDYVGEFSDPLGTLRAPDLVFFIFLWLGVPVLAAAVALVASIVRDLLFDLLNPVAPAEVRMHQP